MPSKKEPTPITIGVNLVERRQCNTRCYYAKSSECSCVCDGQNHGIEREVDEPEQTSMFNANLEGPRSMTKEDFYKDEARKRSRELDFGVWWRDGRNYPVYRVTWVEATGEVYAIDQHEDRIEILGKVQTEAAIEKVMDGWSGVCGLMNSLQWVRNRVA